LTLPRNNLQKYFANTFCAVLSIMAMFTMQMLHYITETLKCGYQIFLPLDKDDSKEVTFTVMVACGSLVWHEVIK